MNRIIRIPMFYALHLVIIHGGTYNYIYYKALTRYCRMIFYVTRKCHFAMNVWYEKARNYDNILCKIVLHLHAFTGCWWTLYEHSNYRGKSKTLKPGSYSSSKYLPGNDRLSSLRPTSCKYPTDPYKFSFRPYFINNFIPLLRAVFK